MSNALNPDLMTPAERIAEIAGILAIGLIRRRAGKSSPIVADGGECFVDYSPTKSGGRAPKGEGT